MRHRLSKLLYRLSEWLDHGHCVVCGNDDRMCCIYDVKDAEACATCHPGCHCNRDECPNPCET